MSHTRKTRPQWMSAYIDGEVQGSAALEIEQRMSHEPAIAQQQAQLAEVVQLLNALPRPEPDPDFALRVHRRIHRRQRGRRRARSPLTPSSSTLTTLGTALALVVVVGTSLLLHPLRQTVESLPVQGAASVASTHLSLVVEAPPASVALWLAEPGAKMSAHIDTSGVVRARLASEQLALLLDRLGRKARLHMGRVQAQGPGQTLLWLDVTVAH